MKQLKLTFVLTMLLSIVGLKESAATKIGGINYNLNSTTLEATVTSLSGTDKYAGAVVIPSSVTSSSKTYSVTRIDNSAFKGCSGLTSVTIPNSVTSIGGVAFANCSGLTSITIPNSVTSIGSSAFNGCSGLTSVTIPNSVTSIEQYTFYNCSGLTSVNIPESVTFIGSSAFYGTKWFNDQPDGVVYLGSCVYGYKGTMPENTSITIKDGTKSICVGAFQNCISLTSVSIPNSVTSIGDSVFSGCSGLTSVTIPNSVTIIGSSAFSGCSGLTSITIPNSVTSIGSSAFSGCSGLTFVTIGKSVTSIGSSAFYGCSGLTSVTLNSNAITSNTYTSSNNMKSIFGAQVTEYVIGDDVTSIGSCAFYGCSDLTSVTIPNSVTSIGGAAFEYCSGLTSLTIPSSVTSIGSYAFYGCSGLTSVTLNSHAIVSNTYTSSNNMKSIFGAQVKKYIIGNEVKSIGGYAFYGCTGLSSFTIPNSVTSIGNWAFYGCSGLTSVTIPNSVKNIANNAFRECSGLTSITIPNSVTSIGNAAFLDCSGIYKVIVSDIAAWCKISFGSSDANPLYYAKHLYSDENTEITNLVIPNSVTSIGNYAFENCLDIISVSIPEGVTSIGDYAFNSCSGLTSVTIPNSVTSIGGQAFYGCSSLTSVTIPSSVTSIGGSAFANCSGLTSVTLNSNAIVSNINTSSNNLKSIFGAQVKKYIIGNEVTRIGNYAFDNCSSLTSVTIGNGVTSIGNYAFSGCTGLSSVTIPNSVTSISSYAFSGCSSLTSVTALNPTPVVITQYVFSNRGNTTLYVPKGSKDAYLAADYWKEFKEIINLPLPTHKLIYMVDGVEYKSYDVEEEDPITPEAAPTKEGYTFSGWNEIPATMPAMDVTITGTFSINSYKLIYKVDGEEHKSTNVPYGATITPEKEPTKEGYTFSGWSEIPETMPAHDVIVTGTFAVNNYELTYAVAGLSKLKMLVPVSEHKLNITAEEGWKVVALTVNDESKMSELKDHVLTINISADTEVKVTFGWANEANLYTEDAVTGIATIEGEGVKVQAKDGQIWVDGAAGKTVRLYTVGGALMTTATPKADMTGKFSVAAGTYIVQVGNKAAKVVVK